MTKFHERPETVRELTRCRGCDAPIFFAKHHESGRAMPVSVKSAEKMLVPYWRDGSIQYRIMDVYLSHYADCPAASMFKPKKEEEDAEESA